MRGFENASSITALSNSRGLDVDRAGGAPKAVMNPGEDASLFQTIQAVRSETEICERLTPQVVPVLESDVGLFSVAPASWRQV